MASTRSFDGPMIAACIAFIVMMMRSISICTFVFLSLNENISRVVAIQVHRSRNVQPKPVQRSEATTFPKGTRLSATRQWPRQGTVHGDQPCETSRSSPQSAPPPYSLSAPPSDDKQPSPGSIMELYESIMASDTQTIQVQQQTMTSQQDIIRSQAQMILKLRHLLEEQDKRVEELEDVARGLRMRRSGVEVAPRSRSS